MSIFYIFSTSKYFLVILKDFYTLNSYYMIGRDTWSTICKRERERERVKRRERDV